MEKKIIGALLATSMTVTLLAGCGSSSSSSSASLDNSSLASTSSETATTEASETTTSADTETSSTDEPVTIEILSLKTEEGPQKAFQEMFDNFTAEHPNVTFDLQSMSSDDLKTTLRARAASGDMPDIVTWMKEIEPEYLLDLTGEDFLNNINQETLAGANKIYDNGIYAMPLDNGWIGLFYNKDVLEANGIEVPKTYNDLISACETLQANGIVPFSSSLSDLSVPYISLIGLFAEEVYAKDPDWSAKRDAGDVTIKDSEGWKAAFDYLTDVVYKYGDPENAYNYSYDDAAANFANGKAAFYGEGSWALSAVRQANPDANIGIMAFPISDSEDDAYLLAFPDTSLSICKDSKNIDVCKEFLSYVASEDAGAIWATDAAVSSSVTGVNVDYDPVASDINSYLSSGKFTPYGDRVLRSVFTDKLWETFSYYMLGEQDWNTFAGTLDEFWDKARDEAANQ